MRITLRDLNWQRTGAQWSLGWVFSIPGHHYSILIRSLLNVSAKLNCQASDLKATQ